MALHGHDYLYDCLTKPDNSDDQSGNAKVIFDPNIRNNKGERPFKQAILKKHYLMAKRIFESKSFQYESDDEAIKNLVKLKNYNFAL